MCVSDIKAQPYSIQQFEHHVQLRPYTKIAKAPEQVFESDDLNTMMNNLPFRPYDSIDFPIQSYQDYVGTFQIQNQLADAAAYTEWILKFSATWTHIDIWISQQDGTFQHYKTGVFVSHLEKSFLPEMEGNFIKLSLPPDEQVTVYFRGMAQRMNGRPNFSTILIHSDIYYESLLAERKSHALFLGFALMMLIYNLIFYFLHREKSYIYYSLYLFAFVFYTSFVSGDLADWVEPIVAPHQPKYMYFGKLSIYLGFIAYIAFIQSFLNLDQLLPKWSKWFWIFSYLAIPWMIADVALMFYSNFSYYVCDSLTMGYILLFVLLNFFFLIALFRKRDKKGYFIIAGLVAICLGLIFTALERQFSATFTTYFAKLGSMAEIIIFSLGLAYRQAESEKAKQQIELDLEKAKIEQEREQLAALKLRELDQIKANFYTNITHELRTPLTIIQGMAEQISGKYQQAAALILRNGQRLLFLVNQMLDLSKIESGKLDLHLQQADIIPFLHTQINAFKYIPSPYQISINTQTDSDSIMMDFDPSRVKHIMSNILSNAIKFMDQDGQIDIKISQNQLTQGAILNLEISDTGMGIAPEDLPFIFNRFYQAKQSTDTRRPGTGIGLALTKELIELMKGSITVNSTLGKGTTFTILLPISQQAPFGDIDIEHSSSYFEGSVPDQNHSRPVILENPDQPLLLIIEDNEDIILYLTSALQDQYRLLTALNGREGIQMAIKYIPDIIISDVMMPEIDGFELTTTLKNDERTSHIPIILLTAKADQASKLQGLNSGADAYLSKPFHTSELYTRLTQLIALRKTLQARYQSSEPLRRSIDRSQTKEDIFLEKIQTHVTNHLSDTHYSIEALSKDMYLSRQQLFRKIKSITGKSAAGYVRSIRLYHGKRLLQNTSDNISEIAYKVGFSDPSYFTKSYTEEFGYPPSEERK